MRFLSGAGYFIDDRAAHGEVIIGGLCDLIGAVSPNTGLPLTQLAKAKLCPKSFFIPEWGLDFIHFLYSWQCTIHQDVFSYRCTDGAVEILQYCPGPREDPGFPYENYPGIFPETPVRLRPLLELERSAISELNTRPLIPGIKFRDPVTEKLSVPAHQFGGIPFLLEPEAPIPACPCCGADMPLVTTIGNQSFSADAGFVGNDFVQVVYWVCPPCRVVSAVNFCD